ncbi:hypothetical protein O6H91_06G046100 [Diphasiastrum complanatum]|nr:hypothetical protein O6H91_06G046100 [Diphasiastrum complanatum]
MRSTVQSAVSASEREEEDEETGKEEGEELRGPTLGCFGFYGERERKRWGSSRSQQKIKDTEFGNALEKGINRNGDAEGFGESTEEREEWEEGHVTATCVGCFRVERQCSQVRAREEDGMETAEVSKDEAIRTENGEDQLPVLPDDILEMCLARAPLLTLMQARIVCKKWRSLTISAHFLQLREKIPSRKPWLFLFGLSRDGVCMGQIQGLDPTSEKWFSIKADNLTGRLLYSVAAIGSSIYVLGGCSSATFPPGRPEKGTLRTHKTVLIFNVLTGQWRKGCSMSVARSMPIVGIFEIKDKHFINENQDCRGDRVNLQQNTDVRRRYRSRRNTEVDVYGGYQAFRSGNALGHNRIADYQGLQSAGVSQQVWQTYGKLDWAEKQENNHLGGSTAHRMERDGCWQKNGRKGPIRPYSRHRSMSELKRYGLIVVGGQGACNEPLESAEVYDLLADRWINIASWPAEYGAVCSGVVCKGLFFAYSETDKLAAYDFDQGLWIGITVSGIPPRLHEYLPKLISCNDRIFLIGVAWRERVNTVREKASRKLWELLEAGSSRMWVEVSQHPDAPLDWNAVFVAHEERIFGVEMFKIFGQVLDFVTVCDVASSPIKWDRVSRRRMAQDMDASSCLTKTAVVLQL